MWIKTIMEKHQGYRLQHTFVYLSLVTLSFLTDMVPARESVWKFNFNQDSAGNHGTIVDMASYMFADSFVTITVACQSATPGGIDGNTQVGGGQEIELSWALLQVDCAEQVYNMNNDMVKKMFFKEPSVCEQVTTTTESTTRPTPPLTTQFIPLTTQLSMPDGAMQRAKRQLELGPESLQTGDKSDTDDNNNVNDDSNPGYSNDGNDETGGESSSDSKSNKKDIDYNIENIPVSPGNNNTNNSNKIINPNGTENPGQGNPPTVEGFDVKGNAIKNSPGSGTQTDRPENIGNEDNKPLEGGVAGAEVHQKNSQSSTQQGKDEQTHTHPDTVSEKKKEKMLVESYAQIGSRQSFSCDTKQNSIVVIPVKDETKFPYYKVTSLDNGSKCQLELLQRPPSKNNHTLAHQVAKAWSDGKYRLYLHLKSTKDVPYAAAVVVEMRGFEGYLSAREWSMLPVTGLMALCYLTAGTFWIFYWARSQEHTKRIHIVIGVVAVAGAMGSTLSFADYSVRNTDGLGISGIRWIGAMISTIQDSLTYLLLMVVSTGYGINRPTISLEWMASMISLAIIQFLSGTAYLVAFDESIRAKYDIIPAAFKLIAAVYAIVNILVTGWIMVFSIYTLVYLIERRHSTPRKLRLFTVFMVACVSVFTVQFITGSYAISQGLFTACRKDWKYEWVDTALNQLEVFILLVVLMWLWRPVDENKSYAFRPIDTEDSLQYDDESADENSEKILLNEF